MIDSPFGQDFSDSRELFVQSARAAGARIESYGYPERGPLGERLSTEVAWIGPSDAVNVLVSGIPASPGEVLDSWLVPLLLTAWESTKRWSRLR